MRLAACFGGLVQITIRKFGIDQKREFVRIRSSQVHRLADEFFYSGEIVRPEAYPTQILVRQCQVIIDTYSPLQCRASLRDISGTKVDRTEVVVRSGVL